MRTALVAVVGWLLWCGLVYLGVGWPIGRLYAGIAAHFGVN